MFLKQAVKIPKPISETRVAIAKNNPFYWPVHPSLWKVIGWQGLVLSTLHLLGGGRELSIHSQSKSWSERIGLFQGRRHRLFRGEFVCTSRSEGYWRGPEGALHVASNVVCLCFVCSALHRISFLLISFKSVASNNSCSVLDRWETAWLNCVCFELRWTLFYGSEHGPSRFYVNIWTSNHHHHHHRRRHVSQRLNFNGPFPSQQNKQHVSLSAVMCSLFLPVDIS
jgi:hypothetical protein